MAFNNNTTIAFNNNALTARLDELRSRNPPRVPSEANTGQSTPFRYSGSYMSNNQPQLPPSSGAETPSLQRRFTADMSKMPIAPIGELNQNTEPLEVPAIVSHPSYCYDRNEDRLSSIPSDYGNTLVTHLSYILQAHVHWTIFAVILLSLHLLRCGHNTISAWLTSHFIAIRLSRKLN